MEETIEKFLEDIEHLRSAKKLLDKIWVEVGPYHNEISQETLLKLRDFYNFDDSE